MSVNKLMSAVLISSLMMSSSYAAINQPAQEDSLAVKVQGLRNFSEIDNVFSQYQYEMDGWDGSDPHFVKDAELRLHDDLNSLMASGVSVKDIQAVMEERILSPKARAEYRSIVEALKVQKASPDEISRVAMNFMRDNQASGSAFSSDGARINYKRVAVIVGAILVAAVIVVSIKKNCDDKKDPPKPPVPPVPPVPPSEPNGNNGWGNGDQDAPGNSCSHNNAENYNCN